MEFTGERMIPEKNEGSKIYLEHLLRYNFAGKFAMEKDVLDIACGSGYGAKVLSDFGARKVFGVDISPEAIDYCKNRYINIDFMVGSVSEIPLPDNSIDLVVSFETLEHVDEKTQKMFLIEIKRVLREDGMLIISTPNAKVSSGENEFHKKELTMEELRDLMGNHFSFSRLFYQDLLEASYIFDQISSDRSDIADIDVVETGKINPSNALFIIALCSDIKEHIEQKEGGKLIGISATRLQEKYGQYDNVIVEKNERLKNMRDELNAKNMEIEKMGPLNIIFLKNKYLTYRNKIVFLVLHPMNFVKKYKEKFEKYVGR